jgi:UDP-galactopyranose mutase
MKKPKLLILGAGFAGAALSMFAKDKFDVTVLDGAQRYGGGNLTNFLGGHPYTFGPRVFFSSDADVIRFAETHLNIRHFYTRSITYVERTGRFLQYPLQHDEVASIGEYQARKDGVYKGSQDFESYWKYYLGDVLYSDVVDKYSKKMWSIESNLQLSLNWNWVNKGTPLRDGDTRLYGDQYQGYPANIDGYNPFFERAFGGVRLNLGKRVTDLFVDKKVVLAGGSSFEYDKLVISIPLDEVLGFAFGRLKYSGRTFFPIMLPVEFALPEGIAWAHYAGNEPYTRVTEFKKITNHLDSAQTLIGVEIPSETGRFYPVQSEVEILRHQKYLSLLDSNVFCVGRHGTFKYKGIPDVIRDAIDVWGVLK